MALKHSRQLTRAINPTKTLAPAFFTTRTLATAAATQSKPAPTSSLSPHNDKSKGTAVVLLNMGGPSTIPEVHDFLYRLFVRPPSPPPLPVKRFPGG